MKYPAIFDAQRALFAKHFASVTTALAPSIEKLLVVSDYAGRNIELLKSLVREDNCTDYLTFHNYQQLLASITLDLPQQIFARELRKFRNRYLLRLMLRELAGLSNTIESMTSWSDCADALIMHALHYAEWQCVHKYGHARDVDGALVKLVVIAMGKLGGRELNFSSDVDLIFVFTDRGITDGESSINNQQYFIKIIQQCVQLLQQVTADGFVYRVDLRLRPNGDSGPLVSHFVAMETYYQEQGRDWERYAMVKARLIAADDDVQLRFIKLITPFVYRRYIDFSVVEALRGMKMMIEREIRFNPALNDIKRGQGGIREIEFFIQCFQLIRGGRMPAIQHSNALTALNALKQEGLVIDITSLRNAYIFFRALENFLQMMQDRQTHALPCEKVGQYQMTIAMGCASWEDLQYILQQHQRAVSTAFHGILRQLDDSVEEDEKRLLLQQLTSLWQGHIETNMAINLLASLGFKDATQSYQILHNFRHAPRCRRLTQVARLRLDKVMVLLLAELLVVDDADRVLLQVIRMLENIVGRSSYLALLTENPLALKELLSWFALSSFITTLFITQPFLLEVLLSSKEVIFPTARGQLAHRLQTQLANCHEDDVQEDILRQFKLTCWLWSAKAEVSGKKDAVWSGRFLADVAAVIIDAVLSMACRQLQTRYPAIMNVKARFAIIAYGKLGSREMNYDSDVDLVFLHNVLPHEESLVIRLTQKILYMLTTRLQSGILYAVDTRLRPSGEAGLLVSHQESFINYQLHQAWTWEHQALLRARCLFANQRMRSVFRQLKCDVFGMQRDSVVLCYDVQNMRAKMRQHLEHGTVKNDAGGLIDLEFLIQYLVLANSLKSAGGVTHTLSLLQHLYRQAIITKRQYWLLQHSYRHYHSLLHQHMLQDNTVLDDLWKDDVQKLSKELYG